MSFTSETIISAPQSIVWDAIESGWHNAADGTVFEPEQSIHTTVDLENCNLIPEMLRRKIGEKLWVTVSLTAMTPGQSVSAHVASSLNYIPSANLSLSLSEIEDETRLLLRGNINASSLRQKPAAALLPSTLLSSLGNYGLSVLKSNVTYQPDQLREEQIANLPDQYLKVS